MQQTRTEKDSMGEMQIPAHAYYGAQTGRAVENFPISELRFSRRFIAAMGLIKWSAAEVNHRLKVLDDKRKQLPLGVSGNQWGRREGPLSLSGHTHSSARPLASASSV